MCYAIKAHGRVVEQIHAFLALASTSIPFTKIHYIIILCMPSFSMKILSRKVSSGMLRHVTLVRTDVSEDPGASFIRVTRIGEPGTTQAAARN
jgi:hypothetical protein